MKNLLLSIALLVAAGCSVPEAESVRVVSKRPAIPAGYILAKYEVLCPGQRAEDLVPVDYYGPDFAVNRAFRQDEYKRSCVDRADGEEASQDGDQE